MLFFTAKTINTNNPKADNHPINFPTFGYNVLTPLVGTSAYIIPVSVLSKVKCPVLMLFGELDTQVPTELNKKAMESALIQGGNKNYTTRIFPKANHLYQSAKTGSPSEYGNLEKNFIPGFLDFMSTWVLKCVDTFN